MSRVLFSNGTNPPQQNLPQFKGTSEMLLYAAWVHGMREEEFHIEYRMSLFNYIQTHIAPKTVSDLQGTIQTSDYFYKVSDPIGWWGLTEKGAQVMKSFGEIHERIEGLQFEFVAMIDAHKIKITPLHGEQEFIIYCDGIQIVGAQLERQLQSQHLFKSRLTGSAAPVRLFNYIIQHEIFSWQILNFPELAENKLVIQDEDDDVVGHEGEIYYSWHKEIERDKDFIRKAKQVAFTKDLLLKCEICKFSFVEKYGEDGRGFIEAHHIIQVSELKKDTKKRFEDLIMVCSNCHKMLHRKKPWISHVELKTLISHH